MTTTIDSHPWDTDNNGVTYTLNHYKNKRITRLSVIADSSNGDQVQILGGFDGRQVAGSTRFNGWSAYNKTNLNQIDVIFFRVASLSTGSGKLYIDLYG